MTNHQQRRVTPRRRILLIDRVENRAPGRVAFLVHRSRSLTRQQAAIAYRLLERWAEQRNQQLEAEAQRTAEGTDVADDNRSSDGTDPTDGPGHEDQETPSRRGEPSEDWTKGELYERARELDIDGRSSMNKAELLEAVRQHASEDSHDGATERTEAATASP